MLDRYLLRYFLAVVDQGNFSRAALSCNVAQPTLSVGIAKLERTLDCLLFVRSNQRIELTDSGTRLLAHARRIEREFNEVAQVMTGSTKRASLRLGVLSTIPSVVVASALRQSPPSRDFEFELVFGLERDLASQLAKGRIDLAVTLVGRGGDRFMEKPIVSEGYSLALARDHALAAKSEIAAEELANDAMIVRRHCEALSETSRHFTERGIRPHFSLRSTNDERVLEMVGAKIGVTIMPDCYVHEAVARPKLTGFKIRRSLGLMASRDAEHLIAIMPPTIKAVVREVEISSNRSDPRPSPVSDQAAGKTAARRVKDRITSANTAP